MSGQSVNCTIPANADITGVGIRASLYGQAFLTVATIVIVCADGKVTIHEGKVLAELRRSLAWTYCALLLTGLIQMIVQKLDPFHATALIGLAIANFFIIILLEAVHLIDVTNAFQSGLSSFLCLLAFWTVQPAIGLASSLGNWGEKVWPVECEKLVQISLWKSPVGGPMDTFADLRNEKGKVISGYVIWIVFGFCAFLPFLLSRLSSKATKARRRSALRAFHLAASKGAPVIFLVFGVVVILPSAALIFVITATERLLARNAAFLSDEEKEWSFGQTMAIIMLGAPATTAIKEAWSWWWERKHSKEEHPTLVDNAADTENAPFLGPTTNAHSENVVDEAPITGVDNPNAVDLVSATEDACVIEPTSDAEKVAPVESSATRSAVDVETGPIVEKPAPTTTHDSSPH